MYRIVILGSGRGSNARAILEASAAGKLGLAEVIGIFSDQPDAGILKLGPEFEVPAIYLNPGPYKTRFSEDAEQHWVETIKALDPQLVVLAGFMRVIKKPFLDAFPRQIINLHPSLLPKYPGLNSIRRAFEAGEKETGCTVHWVVEEVDAGEIIASRTVPIEPNDTLESLEEKVHAAEHQLLPQVIRDLSEKYFKS